MGGGGQKTTSPAFKGISSFCFASPRTFLLNGYFDELSAAVAGRRGRREALTFGRGCPRPAGRGRGAEALRVAEWPFQAAAAPSVRGRSLQRLFLPWPGDLASVLAPWACLSLTC